MTTTAVVPMRHHSERVKGKNYRPLGDRPLYHHIVRTLLDVDAIDEIVIDTDSELIGEDAARHFPSIRILERPAHLRAGDISMNVVLRNTLTQIDADTVVQVHSTNPFVRAPTLQQALDLYRSDPQIDSIFSVTRIQGRLWDAELRAINHDPDVLLRTQDLEPVYFENSCFYVFSRESFERRMSRIGEHPAIIELSGDESVDIDEEHDFQLAETIWERQLRQGA